ncbi:3-ketoacyl-CoA synthase 15 [Vitis vinifera]|uniref:3-ketoacyl-CoA synthase 15 n=1 Tax=Vitis vinifera TaxID=29760 RepID=A0A438DN88_VITVI|nr:3-ketoacyl-CoA synthase 15 [Vitis vinifera]
MGAAAMLLSNCHLDRWRSKYELKQLVRTHKGMDNRSFQSILLKEDGEGKQGLSVSKDVVEVGSHALKDNITTLGPLVLPFLNNSISSPLCSSTTPSLIFLTTSSPSSMFAYWPPASRS